MTKFGISNLSFIILISPYLMGQPNYLKKLSSTIFSFIVKVTGFRKNALLHFRLDITI